MTNYDELYSFGFLIDSFGVRDVGEFKDVVTEFRYYYTASNINQLSKKRFYVLPLDVSSLNEDSFIPLKELNDTTLYSWLESSINEENLKGMKESIHELFNPPIKFYDLSFLNNLQK